MLPTAMAHHDTVYSSGFMDDVMFSYHGTNGQTA